jgi:hypothetical protein
MLLVALPCEQIAQPQQPLDRTLDLLKTRLERYLTYEISEGQVSDLGTARFEAISFEGCRIAWKSSSEVGQNPDLPKPMRDVKIVNQASVNLSSIDPTRTKIYTVKEMAKRNLPRALILEVTVRAGSPGFKQQLETTARGRVTRNALEVNSYSFFFNTNDRAVVDEVSRAFADASEICRSRMKRRP